MMSANPSPTRLTPDLISRVATALATPRRRHVLAILGASADYRLSFDELAVEVTAFEQAQEDGRRGEADEAVESELHHSHLPKMVEADLIEYDRAGSEIVLTEVGIECARMLDIGRQDF